MNISDVHDLILFIERKERLSLHTHTEIDQSLHLAQMELVTDYFSRYQFNQPVIDAFTKLKVTKPFTVADGLIPLPDDYLHLTSVQTNTFDNCNKKPRKSLVRFPKDDELANALSSQLRPVKIEKPIAEMVDNSIQLYPQTTHAGTITYIRQPKVPKYAYMQNGRVITYDPTNSQDLEYSDIYVMQIVKKALLVLGVNLDDRTIMQYSASKENT